ncbi:MAG: ABC transporter permease [Peptococcaceae bacterium]|nr:ABC transporter permease [Peptococcaceae bacterium]
MPRDRLVGWIIMPAILVALFVLATVYFIKNPGGAMAARLLNWEKLSTFITQHLMLVFVSSALAIAAAVPFGIIVSRPYLRVIGVIVENAVNIGQTVPSIAVLALFFTVLGLGFKPAVFALWLYSLLPILRNTYAGIKSVSPDIIEAARGMGMTPWRILTHIELPLAYPIIMAGIRTAVVINVGTATLATFINGGGLGSLIVTGINVQRIELVLAGSILSAIMAVFFDHVLGQVESHLVNS